MWRSLRNLLPPDIDAYRLRALEEAHNALDLLASNLDSADHHRERATAVLAQRDVQIARIEACAKSCRGV